MWNDKFESQNESYSVSDRKGLEKRQDMENRLIILQ